MTPKEKAEELIEKYSQYVSGYVGSSMLTNTEYPEMIIKSAKNCALICVEEIMEVGCWMSVSLVDKFGITEESTEEFWIEVKRELEKP